MVISNSSNGYLEISTTLFVNYSKLCGDNIGESTTIVAHLTNDSNTTTLLLDQFSLRAFTKWMWIIVPPIIFIFGVIGNSGIVLTLYRMKKWKSSAYHFLFILAISDTTVLCIGLSRRWIIATFESDIRDISDFGCKLYVFIIYFSMHFSSWTLVSITVERFIKTKFPLQYRSDKFSKTLKIFYSISIIICLALDTPLIAINGLVKSDETFICNNTSDASYKYEDKYYVVIDFLWLSLIPFLAMFMMNIFIGSSLRSSRILRCTFVRDKKTNRRYIRGSKRLTRMLFFTSVYFLCTTLPISIYFMLDSYLPVESEQISSKMKLAEGLLYLFQFSNYAVNFYIYIKVNPTFRKNLPMICNKQMLLMRSRSLERTSSVSRNTEHTDLDGVNNQNGHVIENFDGTDNFDVQNINGVVRHTEPVHGAVFHISSMIIQTGSRNSIHLKTEKYICNTESTYL